MFAHLASLWLHILGKENRLWSREQCGRQIVLLFARHLVVVTTVHESSSSSKGGKGLFRLVLTPLLYASGTGLTYLSDTTDTAFLCTYHPSVLIFFSVSEPSMLLSVFLRLRDWSLAWLKLAGDVASDILVHRAGTRCFGARTSFQLNHLPNWLPGKKKKRFPPNQWRISWGDFQVNYLFGQGLYRWTTQIRLRRAKLLRINTNAIICHVAFQQKATLHKGESRPLQLQPCSCSAQTQLYYQPPRHG